MRERRRGEEEAMMNRYRQILALLLCAALFFAAAVPGFAEDTSAEKAELPDAEAQAGPAKEVPEEKPGLLDDAALTGLVEGFLQERGIPTERVGIGLYYPETGEEWFYNPDTWFYPASVYKVPLMMILAERLSAGMISEDEVIAGLPLDTLFDYIIVHSNNDYAHEVRRFLGGDEAWREEAKQYAGLSDDYYDPDYMDYCYFTPRYITRVVETLYSDPERFPKVLDNMLMADPTHYFQQQPEMYDIKIAQKYGSYIDMQNTNWNHTTGIIYTPHPFILTVMTENVTGYEYVLGRFAVLFKDYILSLEDKVEPFVEERAIEQAQEAEQLAAEQAAAEAAEQAARAEAERQLELAIQAEQQAVQDRAEQERAAKHLMYSLAATLGAVLVLGILGAVLVKGVKKKKRYEGYRRRFEEELRQEALERERETR